MKDKSQWLGEKKKKEHKGGGGDSAPLNVVKPAESLPSGFIYVKEEGAGEGAGTGRQSAPCNLSCWWLLEAVRTVVTSVAVAAAQSGLSH